MLNRPFFWNNYVNGTPLHQLDLDALVNPTVLQASGEHIKLPTVKSDNIPNPRLASALKEMFDAPSMYGVVQGDGKLHKFIWASNPVIADHVVAVDFEFAYLLPYGTTNIPFYYGLVHDIGDMIDYWSLEDPVAKEARQRAGVEEFKKWSADLRAMGRGIRPLPTVQQEFRSPQALGLTKKG
ncbi:hypothetical protein F5Y12DRAFT_795717 [Xylaria sp. FL1777]|nr:hypothetical protein F5Y12DRAFT_795717 [Xylaria sp. FL1777]